MRQRTLCIIERAKLLLIFVFVLLYFQLLDLCDAYRLTGISVASQEDNRTCFRCDTFFNG